MDFNPAVAHAIQNDLDVLRAFPQVFHMAPGMLDLFVQTLCTKLHQKIAAILKEEGERFVFDNDPSGMAVLLKEKGVRLPHEMLFQISKTIVKACRYSVEWIRPVPNSEGDLWYVKMYIDMNEPSVF